MPYARGGSRIGHHVGRVSKSAAHMPYPRGGVSDRASTPRGGGCPIREGGLGLAQNYYTRDYHLGEVESAFVPRSGPGPGRGGAARQGPRLQKSGKHIFRAFGSKIRGGVQKSKKSRFLA